MHFRNYLKQIPRFRHHTDEIEIDLSKTKVIMELPLPRNLREFQGLQGRLAYLGDSSPTYPEDANCFPG